MYASIKKNEGVALLTATVFVAVAALVLTALSIRTVNQSHQVDQYIIYSDTFQGVESALERSRISLESGGSGMVGISGWPPMGQSASDVPTWDDDEVTPLTLAALPRVEFYAHTTEWATDNADNNGDGVIDDPDERGVYTIRSFARNRTVERATESVVKEVDVNVWRNAIFGGSGQIGGLINGNVSIHGSLHLLGTNIPEGGAAVTAIDLSGTSLIHNNYGGLVSDLRDRVPPLAQIDWNGEMVDTLFAKIRVRNGLVGMSGTSEIGEFDATGNTIKETLDGTFVNDGWIGDSVVDDGDRGDPKNVRSDNGWDFTYNLGNMVDLPLLDGDWREMFTGARVFNPVTGSNFGHAEYFDLMLSGVHYVGDMNIDCSTDFYYNASRPLDTDPANRLPGDDFILFNAATNVMEINGQITVDGNLNLKWSKGNDKTIYYTGRAALLVHGDVTIDTSLLTVNANGTTVNSFPRNNILGIMAESNMYVGTSSQLQLMGAFYAQGMIQTTKQSTIMGTFVSNYFNMGTDVPDIYQVPNLPDNLPYGMIGAYPIIVYERVSWREV